MVRRPGRLSVAALLLLLLVPVAAQAGHRDGHRERPADASSMDAGGREKLERWREAEERRRQRRQTKEAKEERKRSRQAYRRQSKEEALRLAREKQPTLIETPVHDPVILEEGERIERFMGAFGARIDGPNGPSVVDSALPLRSDVGDGGERLLDFSLEDRGETLAPDNPLVETEIAKELQDGLRVDELGVQLESPSPAQAKVVDDRAFFANALADTDLVVLPTATGVQLSLQVRSADAPEQAVFPLSLPEGAEARLVDEGGVEQSTEGQVPPGSVEIVKDDRVLSTIQAPVAWDADEEPLEASYALEGDKLVVRYAHRSADVLYPVVVDPTVADRFRVNEQGQPIGNGSFVIGYPYDPASWYYEQSGQNFPRSPGDGRYDYNGALYIENHFQNTVYYPDNAYGQWLWRAPRQSFIRRADFNNVYFQPTFENYPRAMCLTEGIYSVTRYNWESGFYTDARGFTGSSPFIGGPAPNGSCNTQTNNGKAHESYDPTPGNIAVFRLFAYGGSPRYNKSYAQMGGGAVYLDDNDVPSVTSATSSPGGWVRSGTLTTRVNSTDPGLGVIAHAIDIPIEGAAPTGRRVHFTDRCDRGRISRCPADFDYASSYNTEDVLPDDPAYPATLGPQRIREGVNTIEGDTYDALYKPTHFQAGTIKIDRTPPQVDNIYGDLRDKEDQALYRSEYRVSVASSDGSAAAPRAGVKKTELLVDGVPYDAVPEPCSGGQCDYSKTHTLTLRPSSVTPGERAISVRVTDAAGNASTSAAWQVIVTPDETPPDTLSTGEMVDLDGDYVGRRTLGLAVMADDEDGRGVRQISVEHEGLGVVATAQQARCSSDCPASFSASFDIDTTSFPEGNNAFVVNAVDAADNVTREETVELVVDGTAPTAPSRIQLFDYDALEQRATVDWIEGDDPDIADDLPGSGPAVTEYRVMRGGTWGAWASTEDNGTVLENALPGEIVQIELRAVDAATNKSSVASQSIVVAPVPPRAETAQGTRPCTPRLDYARANFRHPRYREFEEGKTVLGAQLLVYCQNAPEVRKVKLVARLSYLDDDAERGRVPVGVPTTREFEPRERRDVKLRGFTAECTLDMAGRRRYVVEGRLTYDRGPLPTADEEFATDPKSLTCPGTRVLRKRQQRGWVRLAQFSPVRSDDRTATARVQLNRTLGGQPYAPRRAILPWAAHHIIPETDPMAADMQAAAFRCGFHPNGAVNGIYLRAGGFRGLRKADGDGTPNPRFRTLADQAPELAKRTYHADTFLDTYFAELRARLRRHVAFSTRCPLDNVTIEDDVRKAKGDLADGNFGVERPGY